MNVMNDFRDYDHNGNLVFKSTMLNNYLNGSAAYFYSNGALKEEGSYKDDIRTGTWKYYYPDGKLSEVIEFDNGNMLIKEAYSKTGGPLVINGNGKVKILVSGFKQPDSYEARGTVKDGKMNEKWSLFIPIFQKTITTETFKDGKFIKGYENSLVMGSLLLRLSKNCPQ
jgi:antitoxin component YwqK of YwqJK toxin-antitoxin module